MALALRPNPIQVVPETSGFGNVVRFRTPLGTPLGHLRVLERADGVFEVSTCGGDRTWDWTPAGSGAVPPGETAQSVARHLLPIAVAELAEDPDAMNRRMVDFTDALEAWGDARLLEATEIDWRPTHILPEDFYAGNPGRRRNPLDDELRDLERRFATGDVDAGRRLFERLRMIDDPRAAAVARALPSVDRFDVVVWQWGPWRWVLSKSPVSLYNLALWHETHGPTFMLRGPDERGTTRIVWSSLQRRPREGSRPELRVPRKVSAAYVEIATVLGWPRPPRNVTLRLWQMLFDTQGVPRYLRGMQGAGPRDENPSARIDRHSRRDAERAWAKLRAYVARPDARVVSDPALGGSLSVPWPWVDPTSGLDIVILFTPPQPGGVKGGFGRRGRLPAIILPVLLGPYSQRHLATRLTGSKEAFIHEWTHYQDSRRRRHPRVGVPRAARAARVAMGDPDAWSDYYQSPEEFNAYFQEGAHKLESTLDGLVRSGTFFEDAKTLTYARAQLDGVLSAARAGRSTWSVIGKYWDHGFLDHTYSGGDPKWRRKFLRRLAGLHAYLARKYRVSRRARMPNPSDVPDYVARVLEYAPPAKDVRVAPGLRGWWIADGYYLCATCAGRILGRGGQLPPPASPVWRDQVEPFGVCIGCEVEH